MEEACRDILCPAPAQEEQETPCPAHRADSVSSNCSLSRCGRGRGMRTRVASLESYMVDNGSVGEAWSGRGRPPWKGP